VVVLAAVVVDSGADVVDSGVVVVDSGADVVDSGAGVVDSGADVVDSGTVVDTETVDDSEVAVVSSLRLRPMREQPERQKTVQSAARRVQIKRIFIRIPINSNRLKKQKWILQERGCKSCKSGKTKDPGRIHKSLL
jgi:hypothetical protein